MKCQHLFCKWHCLQLFKLKMKYLDISLKICKGYLFFFFISFFWVCAKLDITGRAQQGSCEGVSDPPLWETACLCFSPGPLILYVFCHNLPQELRRDSLPALKAIPCLIWTHVDTEQPNFEVTTWVPPKDLVWPPDRGDFPCVSEGSHPHSFQAPWKVGWCWKGGVWLGEMWRLSHTC